MQQRPESDSSIAAVGGQQVSADSKLLLDPGAAADGTGAAADTAGGAGSSSASVPVPASATPATAGSEAAPSAADNWHVASVMTQFAIASITMIAGNKAAVTYFPLPCTLVIIQAIGTLAILLGFFRSQLTAPTMALLRVWLPISVLFTVMLYTSMKSFVYSGVSTILILRNVGAIVTTVVEYLVRGTTANAATYASEVVIVIGAVMYTGGAVDATPMGLFWILSNVCAQVAYGVLLKHRMETAPELKQVSNYGMSLFNNALAVPMVAAVMVAQGEHELVSEVARQATPTAWSLVLLTCIFGFVISTSGFALQKLVSAATFLVINNLTKFVNILLGVFVLHDRVVGWNGIGGCLLALGAGAWYSWEQVKLKNAAAVKASTKT